MASSRPLAIPKVPIDRVTPMKTLLTIVVTVGLLVWPMGAATFAGKSSKPMVVGKDAPDDWGSNVDPAISPLGSVLGQELVEASIGMIDAKTVGFVIKVASLPPSGGMPEITRFLWDMHVDTKGVNLDGKFTNYSRGICDPLSGQCPPPRDPGPQPFFVRTDCRDEAAGTLCVEKGLVQAKFDVASGTITIPVPLKLLGAKPGSKIEPAVVFRGGITAIPSAFSSQNTFPLDEMFPTKTFVVPR